jgi:glycosyltransferase
VVEQKTSFEHILIDGRSSDRTIEIAKGYQGHFARIESEPDNGIYDAMNKGISLASGDIIGILNADDSFACPAVTEWVTDAFSDPAVMACYGDLEYVSQNDPSRVVRRWISGTFSGDKFYNGWMPPHPTLFLRRKLYDRYGGYRQDLGTSADYEFMLRIFVKHGVTAHYIPKVLVRMRAGGASNHSLRARWRANRNDARAWRTNGLRPRPWTLIAKPLRKVGQWRV